MDAESNRVLVLILQLYDACAALEEDPVDAAFAFLLAVISDSQTKVRIMLTEAWKKYVLSAKMNKTLIPTKKPTSRDGKRQMISAKHPKPFMAPPPYHSPPKKPAIALPFISNAEAQLMNSSRERVQEFPAYEPHSR